MTQNSSSASTTEICLLLPILPGQAEAWRRFVQELQGPQQRDWHCWRRRIGISTIQCRLQMTPPQASVLLQIGFTSWDFLSRGGRLLQPMVENRPFDRWLRQQLRTLHGIDIAHVALGGQEGLILDFAL